MEGKFRRTRLLLMGIDRRGIDPVSYTHLDRMQRVPERDVRAQEALERGDQQAAVLRGGRAGPHADVYKRQAAGLAHHIAARHGAVAHQKDRLLEQAAFIRPHHDDTTVRCV